MGGNGGGVGISHPSQKARIRYSFSLASEKLRYMHRNPVRRGLVLEPQHWAWSSFRDYAGGRTGPVLVNEPQRAELQLRKIS